MYLISFYKIEYDFNNFLNLRLYSDITNVGYVIYYYKGVTQSRLTIKIEYNFHCATEGYVTFTTIFED